MMGKQRKTHRHNGRNKGKFRINDSEQAYLYALSKGKPIPSLEPSIMQVPEFAVDYAIYILKRRWEKAEPVILHDLDATYKYITKVLDHAWEDAERVLVKDPQIALTYALRYKRDWKKLRAIIHDGSALHKLDQSQCLWYATKVSKTRLPISIERKLTQQSGSFRRNPSALLEYIRMFSLDFSDVPYCFDQYERGPAFHDSISWTNRGKNRFIHECLARKNVHVLKTFLSRFPDMYVPELYTVSWFDTNRLKDIISIGITRGVRNIMFEERFLSRTDHMERNNHTFANPFADRTNWNDQIRQDVPNMKLSYMLSILDEYDEN